MTPLKGAQGLQQPISYQLLFSRKFNVTYKQMKLPLIGTNLLEAVNAMPRVQATCDNQGPVP